MIISHSPSPSLLQPVQSESSSQMAGQAAWVEKQINVPYHKAMRVYVENSRFETTPNTVLTKPLSSSSPSAATAAAKARAKRQIMILEFMFTLCGFCQK